MKTVKYLSRGNKPVGIFFHVDKKSTVITAVEPDKYKRGDVAYDKAGRMICRAIYDPTSGEPAFEVQYEVTKILSKPPKVTEVSDEDYESPVDEDGLSDDSVNTDD